MKRGALPLGVVGALLGSLLLAGLAHAQATRTWVSGVGDDANPCSRTAPCKTFAGAISKTAARGEINVLDPGGFGAVTITKAISIINDGSTGGILVAANANGVIINAGASDVVVLRGLDINGLGSGLNGIRFLAGAALHVENCIIYGFTQRGIFAEPSTASQLFVKDSIIRDNITGTGGGILIRPGPPGNSVQAALDNVRLERNQFGLRVEGNAHVAVRHSVASGNKSSGFAAVSTAGANVDLLIENSIAVNNGTNGVLSNGASAMVRLSNVTITGNTTGLLSASGGALISFGNNRNDGNGTDGAPTSTVPLQ